MPVKRALKLENHSKRKVSTTPLVTKKKNLESYSPTTGTSVLSSSPRSKNVDEHRQCLLNGNRDEHSSSTGRHPKMKTYDSFTVLLSAIEDSLEKFMQIRRHLTSLQALEGTRKLENIIGIPDYSCNLKDEVRKTRRLTERAGKRKRLKRRKVNLPAQEPLQPVSSFEFLKSLLH